MMTCDEMQKAISEYWDLPDNDLRRKQINDHMKHCVACAQDYSHWEQSMSLIQQSSTCDETAEKPSVSDQVMSRIYAEEGWREPIPHRIYSISYQMRRKLTMAIAFFLSLFMLGFVYSVMYEPEPETMYYTFEGGVIPIASAIGSTGTKESITGATLQGVPMASLSDPFLLSVNSIQSHPDYIVVISIIGIICTLLIMNWLTRMRA